MTKCTTTKFTYDPSNRLSSATDSQGYQLLFGYDAADRPTRSRTRTAPRRALIYKLLDLASITDRLKRTTNYTYDALRRLIQVRDPLGRTTKYRLLRLRGRFPADRSEWNIRPTSTYDLEERLVAKVFADGTQITLYL